MQLGYINPNRHYIYELILTKNDKITQLGCLDIKDLTYSPRFNQYSELEFTLSYWQNGVTRIKDQNIDLIQGNYLILMNIKDNDTIIHSEYFVIDSFTENGGEKDEKVCHCYSLEYMIFNKKRIRSYTDIRVLYDVSGQYVSSDMSKGGILNYILNYKLQNTWTVGYISPTLLSVYHSYNFSDSTITDVFKQLQNDFNCFILFDNVNQKINIYIPSELENYTNLFISPENYLKNIKYQPKIDQIITRLYVFGKNSTGINKYNITGQSYVENMDYFLNNGYFSSSLTTAWNNYKTLLSNNTSVFTGYVNQLDGYNSQLNTLNNTLASQKATLTTIKDSMNVEKDTNYSNSTAYNTYYTNYTNQQALITSTQNQITTVNNNITTVNNNITTLQNTLSYTTNFTQAQLQELNQFILEDTLNMSSVSDSNLLYQYAVQYIVKKSALPIDFEVNVSDIFGDVKSQLDWSNVTIGSYVYIDYPRFNLNAYPIRLVAYKHNPFSNTLSLTFSNQDKLNSDILYLNQIFATASQASANLTTNQDSYSAYSGDKNNILTNTSTISNAIQAGNLYIDSRGFVGSDIGAQSGSQIQIYNDKICITTDSWATFHTLLSGNGLYLENNAKTNRVVISSATNSFQVDVWNSTLGAYKNAIYLGLDTSSKPALFISNGYVSLSAYNGTTLFSTIKIDPQVGIKINNGIKDVFYVDSTTGNVVLNDMTASGNIIGGTISIGTGNNIFKVDTAGVYLGNTTSTLAPFLVTPAGVLTATNANISGNITGSKIYGADLNSGYIIIGAGYSSGLADFKLFRNTSTYPVFEVYDNFSSIDLRIGSGATATNTFLYSSGTTTYPKGTWNFTYATISNLGATGSFITGDTPTKTVIVSNGIITSII